MPLIQAPSSSSPLLYKQEVEPLFNTQIIQREGEKQRVF